jgi:hypothetical protein
VIARFTAFLPAHVCKIERGRDLRRLEDLAVQLVRFER